MKLEIQGAVPCSICGEYPVLQGGYGDHQHTARLACPNYNNPNIPHGNCSIESQHLPHGFTAWYYEDWGTKEQSITKGIPELVAVWNNIYKK